MDEDLNRIVLRTLADAQAAVRAVRAAHPEIIAPDALAMANLAWRS